MGLPSQLIPALVCLLACSSDFILGRKYNIPLEETIKTLNILTERKDPQCMELTVADVLAAPQNTTEKEILCRVATELRNVYRHHHECAAGRLLSKLDRNLCAMAGKTTCPVSDVGKSTLKDFLERLKRVMKEKYARG
ncbi:interleukin-4 [Pteronotus mesoamericanus]|uniref:interleukin-4 n=1 Tax=Pteronotus mesoamericanus TaxID=1884717 RepID=UPI0023EA7BC5|nr:interleukin-4 [Pteronotus parnellii mesoamericanus]